MIKSCGCEFCNDLSNIQPAKYIGGGNEEFKSWINKADKEKKFVLDLGNKFTIVDRCPVCKYEFTEVDYDSYNEE